MAASTQSGGQLDDSLVRVGPRVAVALIGVYLAFSGWVLAQSSYPMWNAWGVGAALMIIGVNGVWFPALRYVQFLAAAWLAISVPVFEIRGPAMWNTLAVALAVFLISFVPTVRRTPRG